MERSYGSLSGQDLSGLRELLTAVAETPGSWLNMSLEELDGPEAPGESFLFGFLAARGPANPLVTIMRESPEKPVSVGIQHRAGTKAAHQLREAELPIPGAGRVRQDHPRRGLVVEWNGGDVEDLTAWLVPAVRVLNRARTNDALHWEWCVPN